LKQTSDGNPTFVIGDPMNKVHMGKNKPLVSFDNTKLIFKSINYVNSYGACESARDCIIERLNFVIKILYGVRILVETKF